MTQLGMCHHITCEAALGSTSFFIHVFVRRASVFGIYIVFLHYVVMTLKTETVSSLHVLWLLTMSITHRR